MVARDVYDLALYAFEGRQDAAGAALGCCCTRRKAVLFLREANDITRQQNEIELLRLSNNPFHQLCGSLQVDVHVRDEQQPQAVLR